MKRLALIAFLALAACSPADKPAETASAAPANPNALTAEGWGPLTIGMSLADVTAALGPDANPDAVGGPDPETCTELHPVRAPEGLWVMIEDGKLTRITLAERSALKTANGLGLGTPAADVKAAYGAAATASPHKYQGPPAEYVAVWSGGPRNEPYVQDETARGIVYEIDGTGNVGAIHAGGPSIQYVEGCA
jgi:hypothetical protein